MLNVFVISSDKRVDSLIAHFQPFFKSKIRCASDFDNGLKEVFENRPTVVFIQSTIGTVSGETVSRHIKSLLGSESPRIVFMGDIDNQGKKGTSWCDDWIRVSDSAQQLQQDFAELISRSFPEDWQGIHKEMEKTASSPADNSQAAHCPEGEISVDHGSQLNETDASEFASIGEADEILVSKDNGVSGNDVLGLDSGIVDDEEFPAYQNLYEDPLSKSVAFPAKRRFAAKLFLTFFLLAVAGGGLYFWTLRNSGMTISVEPPVSANKAKADLPVAPSKIKGSIKGLPSFVRSEWRDASYTSQHPGWERYLSPTVDFRIFREQGMIQALQGISRDQTGISEVFLHQVLEQFGLNGPLPDGKEDSKNGFLVKNMVFPEIAELVTYHEQGDTKITAFVLEFF